MVEFGTIMGLSGFDTILLPSLAADIIVLLYEILSIPYKLGTSWFENDYFDLHALVDHFSEAVDDECYP
jgi:hypothetical protein